MKFFKRGPVRRTLFGWGYLLRVTARGFFGELSQAVWNAGRGMVRNVRRAALLSVRRWRPGQKSTARSVLKKARRPRRWGQSNPTTLPPPFPPTGQHRPGPPPSPPAH